MGMMKRCNENEVTESAVVSTKSQSPKLPKLFWGEKLTRNLVAATLLLCCAISARDVMITPDQTALQVLQTAVKSEWDENLGRLVYVNGSLSDAISVFSSSQASMHQPSLGNVADVFSDETPYIVYQNAGTVYAAMDGEVMSITQSAQQIYTLRIRGNAATECLYYGLESCIVSEGDIVSALTVLGNCGENDLYFEVRKNGAPVDASALFAETVKE